MERIEPHNRFLHLVIFFLSLAVPFVLFVIRHLDNNRLTSWNWAFNQESPARFLVIFPVVLVLAWLASRVSFSKKVKPPGLFVTSFAAAACFWVEPEVIVDAARYFIQAKHLKVYGAGYFFKQWGEVIFAWTDLPLVPFLYGLLFKFLGEQRIAVQVFNTVLYSLSVLLTYRLGKSLWDEETGFLAACLLMGFPYLYTQVPLMLVDVPTMFFFMLAVVTCFEALQKGGAGRIAIASFSLPLLFYVKYSGWVLLAVIPVIFAYFLFQKPLETAKRGCWLALLSVLLIGLIFLAYREVFLDQIHFIMEYQKPGLGRWSESYVSTFLFQTHPFLAAAALFSFIVAVRKKDFRFLIICFLFLLFLFMQVKRIRYTLPIFPMIALMAAYGIGVIRNGSLKKHLVFSIAATSFAVALTGFLPLLKSLGVQNLQSAGRYLNTISAADVEVVTLAAEDAAVNPDMGVPVLDIYTYKNLYYDNKPIDPQKLAQTRGSSLRFTWEFPMPRFYSLTQGETTEALVVISDRKDVGLPLFLYGKTREYPIHKDFQQSSQIFQHQTFVTVYHK